MGSPLNGTGLHSDAGFAAAYQNSYVRRSVPSPIGSMPVIIILAPQFWHLRLSMIFSGLGINWV
ncbi:MAG: hypothetical protein WA801_09090 [Pseudolabrys sp.]